MISGQKRIFLFAVIFLLLIIAPVGVNQYYNYLLQPATPQANEETDQIFVIPPGQPVVQIAQNLEEAGLIKSALAFRLLVVQSSIEQNLQAGDFRLNPSMSARDIAKELTHGAIDIWVTIPEGFRVEETAERIGSKLQFGSNDKFQFVRADFIRIAKEGYMFPDTYLIPRDSTFESVSDKQRTTFDEKASSIVKNRKNTELNEDEVVIMASLIEREAKTAAEKSVIAGILMNRLRDGIALQVDATVSYAKGYDAAKNTWWAPVTTDDYINAKSQYNTYLFSGLPPGPICSPGLESIRAASDPAKTEFYYYLHEENGRIHYAKTADEHNSNIEEFLY